MAAPSSIAPLVSSDFVTVLHDQPISKALAALKRSNGLPAVVLNGGDYKGLISPASFLRNVDVSKAKIASVVHAAPTLSSSHSFEDAVRLMRDADARVLAVVERRSVKGIVSASSVLKQLAQDPVFKDVRAVDLRKEKLVSISQNDDLGKAIQLMKDKKVRKLPVLDMRGNPVGVVKLEEIAGDLILNLDRKSHASFQLGKGRQSIPEASPWSVSVKSVMDEELVVVSPQDKASSVIARLSEQSNPVVWVKGGGLITTQDVLKYYLDHLTPVQESTSITITHLPDIDEIDRAFLEETLQRTFSKVERTLKSEHRMHVVYKQLGKNGLRAQTNVKLTIEGAGKTFHAEATDWKVRLATKEACRSLEAEVSKRFRR